MYFRRFNLGKANGDYSVQYVRIRKIESKYLIIYEILNVRDHTFLHKIVSFEKKDINFSDFLTRST
jgi:hypothetical protein